MRKLQENVFKLEELRFSNQIHNTAFGIEVADRLNSLKRNLTNQQNKLEGIVQDVARRLLKSLNLDSFWTHSIEERFNKHLKELNILWKKTNHQSQYINDLNSKCMEHNIYLNDFKAWGYSSKGFFEDIYDKIKVIQERMDADTAQFNKLANDCRIVLERQVLSGKNKKIRIARMNKLHDEFDRWLGVVGRIDTRLSSIENQSDTFQSCKCKKVPLAADQSRNSLGGTEPLEKEDRQFGFHDQRDNTPKSILTALKSNEGGSTLLEEPGSSKSHEELAKKEVERIKKKDG